MTHDRIAGEFPESRRSGDASSSQPDGGSAKDAAVAGASPSGLSPDAPVTIQEILRATAGPNPISGVGKVPLDHRQPGGVDRRRSESLGGRRMEDADYVASRYQASETAQRRNRERKQRELDANWRHTESPRIPRGFGRKRWPRPKIEVVLGVGTLVSVALLIASMTLRVIFEPSGPFAPVAAPHPMAQVVNASALGYLPALPASAPKSSSAAAPLADPFAATPALVAGQWRRVGRPLSYSLSGASAIYAIREDVAAYDSFAAKGIARVSPVRVWVQHLRSSDDALACLTSLAERRQSLQRAENGMRLAAIRWEIIAGQRTAVFDNPTGEAVASDIPGEVAVGSLRAWQQGSNVITVAAVDSTVRDDFARDYLHQAL